MKITRTYPTPDSSSPHLGARERALAVFKYLLDLEPEVAVKHPLFACIERSYSMTEGGEWCYPSRVHEGSLIPELSSTREVALPETPIEDAGL